MVALLRHPALVPALFSGAVDTPCPAAPRLAGWRRLAMNAPFGALSVWAVLVVVEVTLIQGPVVRATVAFLDRLSRACLNLEV